MSVYIVTTKQAGTTSSTHRVEAASALAAINQIEAQYKARPITLSGKNGQVQHYTWTGFEYEARRIG